jgi:quercetin dioxygenase-like cupin family protein
MPLSQRIDETTSAELAPGVTLRCVHGETMTVSVWTLEQGAEVPPHAHPHEQVVCCAEGELVMDIEGEEVCATPETVIVVPGNHRHSARATVASRGVDVFNPVRDDYRFDQE